MKQLPHERLIRWFSGKRRRTKIGLICAVVFVSLSLCLCSAVASTPNTNQQTAQAAPTHVTSVQKSISIATTVATATSVPTKQATIKPTQQATQAIITATNGTPYLGGPISDFYGKYGADINGVQTNGDGSSSVGWLIDPNNADGGYILITHYSGSAHLVSYIAYNGPSSWSKAQYRDFLIASFSPPGTVEDTQANQWWVSQSGDPYDPIAYTSDIGRFFLHISDGNGNMNTW